MKDDKSTIESICHNLVKIICVTILFLIFGIMTYRIPVSLSPFNGLSVFAVQFYASILQIIIIFLIFKYFFKKEDKEIEEDKKKFKTNLFDVFILLFIGMSIAFISLLILIYLQDITNTVPKYYNTMAQKFLEVTKITRLDRIYRFIVYIILVPIIEEFIFRKVVFKYFQNRDEKTRDVILISGISFGLIHILGVSTVVSSTIIGIAFATIYAITKNIIYPIIGHGLINFMSYIISIFKDNSIIVDFESYIENSIIFELKGAIIISLILLIITSIISYIKRKVIISLDFKDRVKKVFTE